MEGDKRRERAPTVERRFASRTNLEGQEISRFAQQNDPADCSADVDGDHGDASRNEQQAAIGIVSQLRALGAEPRAIGDDLDER